MKAALLRVVNVKLSVYGAAKENIIHVKTLGMYAGKFHRDKRVEMKPIKKQDSGF